jgi:hypothetical protein
MNKLAENEYRSEAFEEPFWEQSAGVLDQNATILRRYRRGRWYPRLTKQIAFIAGISTAVALAILISER